jgi:phage terminase small subunit
MALSLKQERFVVEYLVDLNATAAAIRAGYSERTAAQKGYGLLQMPEVQEAITSENGDRQKRTKVTADQVVSELASIAFAKADEYYRDFGLELKVSDKTKALELLGKHFGTFTDKIAISGIDPKAVEEVEALIRDTETGG